MALSAYVFVVFVSAVVSTASAAQKPHILHIQVSDLGWNDVGWRASEFVTPNLKRLRADGIDLTRFYTQPYSFNSRVAVATGRYPYKLGYLNTGGKYHKRNRNITLSLDYKLLPEYLQSNGYSTHLVGSWMLGFCDADYHPFARGFKTFYGSLGGYTDHFSHMDPKHGGYDFWDNDKPATSAQGEYSTTLVAQRARDIIQNHGNSEAPLYIYLALEALHKPLQAPNKYLELCDGIAEGDRKMRCAMMAAVDEEVDDIVYAMEEAGYDENLLVLFTSLNSGSGKLGSMSYPLRGRKGNVYEGGTRVQAFMYSKTLLPKTVSAYSGMMHATDLLPTLLEVAQVPRREVPTDIDGVSMWGSIVNGSSSPRTTMVYDIDTAGGIGAVRQDKWKLVYFKDYAVQKCTGWRNFPDHDPMPKRVWCKEWELYDVEADPSEKTDRSEEMPAKLNQLKTLYGKEEAKSGPTVVAVEVPWSDPQNYGGVWTAYGCEKRPS